MDLPDLKLYETGTKNGRKKATKMGLGKKIFYSITEADGKSHRSITIIIKDFIYMNYKDIIIKDIEL